MISISDKTFINLHDRLRRDPIFRVFWIAVGIYGILVYGIFATMIYFVYEDWSTVLLATLVGLINFYVVCKTIHYFHKKPHPYQRLNFTPPSSWLFSLLDRRKDSFPSEHASTMAAISMVLYLHYPTIGLWAFAVAIFVSVGRIVLGYHDGKDVIAGLLVGAVVGLITIGI